MTAFFVNAQFLEKVKEINPNGDALPMDLVIYNEKLYFTADDGVHGHELWVSDGTEEGTVLLKDLNDFLTSSNPQNFYLHNGKVFFTTNLSLGNVNFWQTNGTEEGTIPLYFSEIESRAPQNFISYNGELFFTTMHGYDDFKFWKYNADGLTQIIYENTPSGQLTVFSDFIIYEDTLYFSANLDEGGIELWRLTTDALNVKDVQSMDDLKVYPNPAKSTLNIKSQNEIKNVKLMDATGRTVLEKNFNSTEVILDVSNLQASVYFINITTKNSKHSTKIIVE